MITDIITEGRKWLLAALGILGFTSVAWGLGYMCGALGEQNKQAERAATATLAAVQAARVVEGHGDAITAAVGAHAATQAVKIQTVTKEVIIHVPQIITPEVDSRYPLPNGFVRLHDAGVAGDLSTLSQPASEPDDAPSDVAASEAAVIIAANYGSCAETSGRLTALQDWVKDEQKAYDNGGN